MTNVWGWVSDSFLKAIAAFLKVNISTHTAFLKAKIKKNIHRENIGAPKWNEF